MGKSWKSRCLFGHGWEKVSWGGRGISLGLPGGSIETCELRQPERRRDGGVNGIRAGYGMESRKISTLGSWGLTDKDEFTLGVIKKHN